MESDLEDGSSRISSREGSHKELNVSRSSIKSSEKAEKVSSKGSIKIKEDKHDRDGRDADGTAKGPNKIIMNWRHACDRTRDRTRDLLKRWRTLPEYEAVHNNKGADNDSIEKNDQQHESGWSVHVWTTWVDRLSVDQMEGCEPEGHLYQLTPVQKNKFSHFFNALLDHDQDELISQQDIESLIERLRHFADWSTTSTEYNILCEIERGFIDTFLDDIPDQKFGFQVNKETYLTLDGWLYKWAKLISGCKNLGDFPIWLQYFVKVLFQVINRSGSGIINRDEQKAFYSSVLGLDSIKVNEILNIAYQAMTSNGDHVLNYSVFRLSFSNYLLGRYPNGPGQYILGAAPPRFTSTLFPVDYSALNAQPEDLEQYGPDNKTNRRSVIV